MNCLPHENLLADGTLTGGEPSPDALPKLREAGYTTLISLRGVGESPNEASYFTEQGFQFVHLPISGPADFSDSFLESFDQALSQASGKTVVFCATANRVGAAFALHAHRFKGTSTQDALALGRRAGLTRLEGFVQQQLSGQ